MKILESVLRYATLIVIMFLLNGAASAQLCVAGANIGVSPASQSLPSTGATNQQFDVIATIGCAWTVPFADSWLSGTFTGGTGSGTVVYNAAANPDLCQRTGHIDVKLTSNGSSAAETIFEAGASGDFSIGVSPSAQSVVQGGAVSFNVAVNRTGGFAGNVALSASGMPAGVTASFSNFTFSSATLKLTAASNASTGMFPITVTGVNSCQSRSATPVTLQVVALPSQAVYYIGTDQHVYEADLANNIWGATDLTALTGVVSAATGSGLTSFKNGSTHAVYFVGTNQHVYQLFWNTGVWTSTDLTQATGNAVFALSSSALTSYTSSGAGHSVYYIDTSQNLRELNFDGSLWHNGNLTLVSRANFKPATNSALTSFLAPSGGISVYYVATDGDLHEMNFNTVSWHDGDVTLAAATQFHPLNGTGLTCFIAASGGISVYYVASDGDLHEMNFNTVTWHDGDLTLAGRAPFPPLNGTGLTSFMVSNGAISVYYVATDLDVHEMNFNLTTWNDGDVTLAAGNLAKSAGNGGLSSFIAGTGGISVFYLAAGGHLDDLNFNGSLWNNGDLSMITGGNPPATGSSLTSFTQQ